MVIKRENVHKQSRLVRSDVWDIAFSEFNSELDKRFSKVKAQILEKRFTVKDSGATYRLINHWAEVGIIDDSYRENNQGWRKLSFIDLIWVYVLTVLRRFGMPLDKLIRSFQSTFYSPANLSECWPILEFSILRCLQRDPVFIIVFSDGWCEYIFKQDYDLNMNCGILNEKAYLVINLNKCVAAVSPKLNAPKHAEIAHLSEVEMDVIEKLRQGNLGELHLKLKDGKVHSLKKIYRGKDNYQGLIDKIEYGEYTVKRQNGKTVFTEVTELKHVKS